MQALQNDAVSVWSMFTDAYRAYRLVNRMVAKYIERNGERDKDFYIHDEHIAHRKEHALPLLPVESLYTVRGMQAGNLSPACRNF